jgi:hypothetical protein
MKGQGGANCHVYEILVAGFALLAFFTTKAVKGGEQPASWRGSAFFSTPFRLLRSACLNHSCMPVGPPRRLQATGVGGGAPPPHPPPPKPLVSSALLIHPCDAVFMACAQRDPLLLLLYSPA